MKRLSFLLLAILSLACTPSEQSQNLSDCNCDRVKEVNVFSVIGTPQNPQTTYHCVYITINECSGVQKEKTFDTYNPDNVPQINQCR